MTEAAAGPQLAIKTLWLPFKGAVTPSIFTQSMVYSGAGCDEELGWPGYKDWRWMGWMENHWNYIQQRKREQILKFDSNDMIGWLRLCQNLIGLLKTPRVSWLEKVGDSKKEMWMNEW